MLSRFLTLVHRHGQDGRSSIIFCQAEDVTRAGHVTGVQTCALPISTARRLEPDKAAPRARWRKVAGVSAVLAAAAAIAAALAKRIKPGTTTEADEDEPAAAEPVQASADGAAPKPARTS